MNIRRLRWRFYKKTGGPRGWGNRCSDYGPGCALCERYRFMDDFGRWPTKDDEPELRRRIDEASEREYGDLKHQQPLGIPE